MKTYCHSGGPNAGRILGAYRQIQATTTKLQFQSYSMAIHREHQNSPPLKETRPQEIKTLCHRLVLPLSMKIYPVLHVSLLEPICEYPVEGQLMPPPPPVEIERHEEWEVDGVLDSYLRYRRPLYLVK